MLETTTHESLASADIAHLIHQLTRAGQHARTGPVIVESASGATLKLADGREILDGTSGLWCVNIGHGRAELADAAATQMRRLAFAHTASGFSHQPAIELATRLASLTPGDLTAAYFTSGGAESTETAFKFARYYWRLQGQPGKSLILSHVRGYHGLTHGAASATGLSEYHGILWRPRRGIRQGAASVRLSVGRIRPQRHRRGRHRPGGGGRPAHRGAWSGPRGRRDHGARARYRRRDRAAGRLLPGRARGVQPIRRAHDRGRGDHRFRSHGAAGSAHSATTWCPT